LGETFCRLFAYYRKKGIIMKIFIQKVTLIFLIGLFGIIGATPVHAIQMPFFGARQIEKHEIREATAAPRNMVRKEIREASPGGLRKFLDTRGYVSGNVTAVSGTTLTMNDKNGKSISIITDDKTQIRRLYFGKGTLAEIQVGDRVDVIGKWTDDTKTTIQARLVRDLSIQKRYGVFFGTVQSLSSTGWVMTTVNRGNQTVTVSSATKFTDGKETVITQPEIVVGHKVRVRGLWDKQNNTVTEVTQVKDFSLPVHPTP
jgi:hypothetical protein